MNKSLENVKLFEPCPWFDKAYEITESNLTMYKGWSTWIPNKILLFTTVENHMDNFHDEFIERK